MTPHEARAVIFKDMKARYGTGTKLVNSCPSHYHIALIWDDDDVEQHVFGYGLCSWPECDSILHNEIARLRNMLHPCFLVHLEA